MSLYPGGLQVLFTKHQRSSAVFPSLEKRFREFLPNYMNSAKTSDFAIFTETLPQYSTLLIVIGLISFDVCAKVATF